MSFRYRRASKLIGIIGGTNILEIEVLRDVVEKKVETAYGTAEVDVGYIDDIKVALIQRHGKKQDKPPHVINHAANFAALKELGVEYVIGMGSVGCLREEIELPALIIPDDYIDFFSGATIFNNELVHITPGFDEEIREVLIRCARGADVNVIEKGVYFQSRGPRLETRAEIRVIKNWADCVGMTAAAEATIAKELGLKYAVICTMDNYAHGIKSEVVDYEEIRRRAKENAGLCLKVIEEAVRVIWNEYIDKGR
ncbi:phosphorylase family protein [Archaeoglobus veneficus]|uniref:Methylthioadenosine phosphorylase n=1 Tax=Archaeoglobus veneficus (strain DSM 11195 / SNP6) TaxID=693661 RepID=F2KT73_ARCVS|nr:6-oxopurine nucleoside phosphorylase [Archaeoglobus veneficus]AEA47103.1 methylthioadenosine phosphorylase [Archaeoglobus veneficus SNP6]